MGKRKSRTEKLAGVPTGLNNDPITDMDQMTVSERELFLSVVQAGVQAVHSTQGIQQAKNMENYFATSCRQAMYFAGLHVLEYRKLNNTFNQTPIGLVEDLKESQDPPDDPNQKKDDEDPK